MSKRSTSDSMEHLIQQLLEKRGVNDRQRTTLYLSRAVFQEFRDSCQRRGTSASQVIEELMNEFRRHATPKKDESA